MLLAPSSAPTVAPGLCHCPSLQEAASVSKAKGLKSSVMSVRDGRVACASSVPQVGWPPGSIPEAAPALAASPSRKRPFPSSPACVPSPSPLFPRFSLPFPPFPGLCLQRAGAWQREQAGAAVLIGELPLAELTVAFLPLPAATGAEPGGIRCSPGGCHDWASPGLAGRGAEQLHAGRAEPAAGPCSG